MDTDVIVIGAGPTGLMLAAELRLGGADVTLFEQRAERSWESRGLGFTARTTEIFEQRGLMGRLDNAEITRQGHFGGIPIDYGLLEGAHFGVRGVPQYKIEEMLEDWALELGVVIRRGAELTALEDTGDQVRASGRGPDGSGSLTAQYLVGCDGGHSTVRRLAGMSFPGTPATREMYLADVAGCSTRTRMIGEQVPGGMVMAAPLEKGYTRIIVCENGTPPDKTPEVTFVDVADAWQRLTGESIHHGNARWVSRFTDATALASQYRRGRVLVAGDAAHIHLPAGGQGLSLGVQDAVNLGWKLAATVRGRAPAGLLDTYHSERHPVGAQVLRNTRSQQILNLSGTSVDPLRDVMARITTVPAAARHLIAMVSGLDIRYDMQEPAHPLTGLRMRDRDLEPVTGDRTRIAELLRPARGLLITTDDSGAIAQAAAGWPGRVDLVRVRTIPRRPEDGEDAVGSVLVRPDGYVAWAAADSVESGVSDVSGDPRAAMRRWFGTPVPLSAEVSAAESRR